MKRPNYLVDDPVVEEVRAVRRRVLQMSDGTVKGYIETLHRLAEERTKQSSASGRNGKPRNTRHSDKVRTLTGCITRKTAKRKSTRAIGRKKA